MSNLSIASYKRVRESRLSDAKLVAITLNGKFLRHDNTITVLTGDGETTWKVSENFEDVSTLKPDIEYAFSIVNDK